MNRTPTRVPYSSGGGLPQAEIALSAMQGKLDSCDDNPEQSESPDSGVLQGKPDRDGDDAQRQAANEYPLPERTKLRLSVQASPDRAAA